MSKDEKTMICPFCDEELRFGVKVCRGCQAEITYVNYGFWCLVLSIGLSYVLFGTNFINHQGTFFIVLLLIDILLLITGIATFKNGATANFERRKFR